MEQLERRSLFGALGETKEQVSVCIGSWGGGGHVKNNRNFILYTSDMLYLGCFVRCPNEAAEEKDKQVWNSRERKGWPDKFATLRITREWERLHETPESMDVPRAEKRPETGVLGHPSKTDWE